MIVRAADIPLELCERPDAKIRRDALRAAGRCICGPKVGEVGRRGVIHGPVVAHGKCQRCLDVHKVTR